VHTATSIFIKAPRERVFAVVQNLAQWPKLLPHYRAVTTLGTNGDRQIVKMQARRGFFPVGWVSEFEVNVDALELRFEHLRAWTKGMKVVWTLTPTRDGTRVEIVHDLKFRVPFLRWLAEPLIGRFFIDNIARKTLRAFKQVIEAEFSGP
jgi:ribosome-associated toxin RatA of RatAB toxin-antitoxin module